MIRLFNVESVSDAAIEAEAARARLFATLGELQARVAPASLAQEAIGEIRTRSAELAGGATQLARRNPGTTAATVAAAGMLLAHRPILGLLRRLTGNKRATPDVVDPNREDAKPWIERTSG